MKRIGTFFVSVALCSILVAGAYQMAIAQTPTDKKEQDVEQQAPQPTNTWAIRTNGQIAPQDLAERLQATFTGPIGNLRNHYTFDFTLGEQRTAVQVDSLLKTIEEVEWFERQYLQRAAKRFNPTDPLFNNQWHLRNTGQGGGTAGEDVNMMAGWALGYTGNGINIAVIDDGVQLSHPDLIENRWSNPDETLNGQDDDGNGLIDDIHGWNWNATAPGNNNVEGIDGDNHGTACAGVAAARDNNLGGIGAAYRSKIAGLRLIAGGFTNAMAAAALSYKDVIMHISSNSWGPPDTGILATGSFTLQLAALEQSVQTGRGGKGTIFSWAGGNGAGKQDNISYDPLASSRFTIAVGATSNFGTHSSYSEPGAPLLVNAPSNGGSLGITTVDRVGTEGYNNAASPNGDYTNNFGGTSSACPLVTGIIALMLEANPELTWRDVQHILVNTADKNDPNDADWRINGAGHLVNHKYGYGRINAERSIRAALDWRTVPAYQSYTSAVVTVNQAIPDNNPTGVTSTINLAHDMFIEHVEVIFSATHSRRGDLRVVLISPSGTESVFAETRTTDDGADYNSWMFTSVRHWGEESAGNWTLRVSDERSGTTGTFGSWRIIVHGTENPAQPMLVGPAQKRSGLPTTVGFGWQPFPTATSYDIQVSTMATFVNTVTVATVPTVSVSLANLPANTTLYWRVRANLPSTTSNWSQVREFNTVQSQSLTYCTPSYGNPCSSGDFINNFSFAGITNNNSGCNGQANNYIFYSNLNANVSAGQTYAISMQANTVGDDQGFAVWIDYNQDGVFAAGEQVFSAAASTTVQNGNITIPAGAINGVTRMRVRSQWNAIPSSPCSSLNYGEAEDYVVTISGGANRVYDIGGFVLGETPVAGVQLALGGSASATTATMVDGFYTFAVTQGTYTVTPSAAGLEFTPTSLTVSVTSANFALGFQATPVQQVSTPTLSVTPAALNFGSVTVGGVSQQEAQVQFAHLQQNIAINAAVGYSVSTDGTNFSPSLSISSGATLPVTLTVRFSPTVSGSSSGTITLTSGATSASIAVTGEGAAGQVTQVVDIENGWNMVSSRVSTANMALSSLITSPNVFLVKNNAGAAYVPSMSIAALSTWENTQGYQIFATGATTIGFTGQALPFNTPIPLSSGWNMIAYLVAQPQSVVLAMGSVAANLVLVKNNAGQVYVPTFNINAIGSLQAGQGYQVFVNAPSTLIYPNATRYFGDEGRMPAEPVLAAKPQPTGNNAVAIIKAELADGTEIGAFTKTGQMVGVAVVEQGIAPLTIWGADRGNTRTGAAEGEALSLRVIDHSGERPLVITALETAIGTAVGFTYQQDALYLLEVQDSRAEAATLTVAPNPAREEMTVRYVAAVSGEATLRLTDVLGRDVVALPMTLRPGVNSLIVNVSGFTPGMYTVEIAPAKGERVVSKVMVVK